MGDRRQPLDVPAEDPANGLGLGLAQLRELVGYVGDRAVLLAQLLPHDRQVAHGRGVPLVSEDLGERLDRGEVGVAVDHVVEPVLDERHAAVREFPDSPLAAGLGDEAERLHGQVVVLLVEVVAPGLGQGEQLGGPATAARGDAAGLARLEHPLLEEVVEVAAYGGRREVEPLGQSGGGGGSVDQDRAHDSLARRLVAGGLGLALLEFHNNSVPLLFRGIQVRTALP